MRVQSEKTPRRIISRLILPTPILFFLVYWWQEALQRAPGTGNAPVSIWDHLVFSLRTMVTLAYSDLTPVGVGQWLAPVEGALGVAFFALLAFSVAKRISRD